MVLVSIVRICNSEKLDVTVNDDEASNYLILSRGCLSAQRVAFLLFANRTYNFWVTPVEDVIENNARHLDDGIFPVHN